MSNFVKLSLLNWYLLQIYFLWSACDLETMLLMHALFLDMGTARYHHKTYSSAPAYVRVLRMGHVVMYDYVRNDIIAFRYKGHIQSTIVKIITHSPHALIRCEFNVGYLCWSLHDINDYCNRSRLLTYGLLMFSIYCQVNRISLLVKCFLKIYGCTLREKGA